jgi:hypothetical protein
MKTPTDIYNWEDFLKAFERVFHDDWTTTLAKLPAIATGTFLQPQPSEGPLLWENRDALLKAYSRVKPEIELAVVQIRKLHGEIAKYETWITGEVFSDGKNLLFRAERPIDGTRWKMSCCLVYKRGWRSPSCPSTSKQQKGGQFCGCMAC